MVVDFVSGIVRMEAGCKQGAPAVVTPGNARESGLGRLCSQKKLFLAKTLIDAKLGRMVAPISICDLLHEWAGHGPSRDGLMFFGKKKNKHFQSLGLASMMGIHLVSGVIVGMVMGYYLDKYFDTKPWLLLLFLVFGIIAGYRNMFREMQRIQKKEAEADAPDNDQKD